jgi:hypothetical protein
VRCGSEACLADAGGELEDRLAGARVEQLDEPLG